MAVVNREAIAKRETEKANWFTRLLGERFLGWNNGANVISEIIGRVNLLDPRTQQNSARFKVRTVDQTIPDYSFWDHLRRGKARGYSLGALFATRIERVLASWVLGSGLEIKLAIKAPPTDPDAGPDAPQHPIDYTNSQLAEFVAGLLDSGQDNETEDSDLDRDDYQSSLLLTVFRDALGLGDQYIIVNPDGSLSVPSPDTVTVERDPLDYRRMLSVIVTSKLDKFTIEDTYTAFDRTIVIKEGNQEIERQQFANLIGRIPVVHVAHAMGQNETNGHPIHEQLLALYDQYDDVIYKQLDGVKLFGIPILALVGLADVNQAFLDNQPLVAEEYTDQDGNVVERPMIKLDTNSILMLGEGGDAKYVTPPTGFTEDTKQALKSLFLMLLDFTGIPEFVWGNELSSARASSDTQMAGFEKEIGGYRNDNGGWIVRLCKIWLQTKALIDPRIVVDRLELTWPELLEGDRELLLKFVAFAEQAGLLTDEQTLRLLELVDDAAAETQAAREEADERREALLGADFTMQLSDAQRMAQNGGEPEPV